MEFETSELAMNPAQSSNAQGARRTHEVASFECDVRADAAREGVDARQGLARRQFAREWRRSTVNEVFMPVTGSRA